MSFRNPDAEICAISEFTSIFIIYFLHISKDTLGNLGNLFLAKAKKKKINSDDGRDKSISHCFIRTSIRVPLLLLLVPLRDIFPNPKFKNLSCES